MPGRRRAALTSALALGLGGCRPLSTLPEVPIVGGTPEQQEWTRDALLAFDEDAGVGRVHLRKVEIGDAYYAGEERAGLYKYRWQTVFVSDALDPDPVDWARTVRHELCHALDDQEGELFREVEPELAALTHGFDYDLPDATAAKLQQEVLAQLCERGPDVAHALAQGCPTDPPEFGAVFRWLSERVWTEGTSELHETVLDEEIFGEYAVTAPGSVGLLPRRFDGRPGFRFDLEWTPDLWIVSGEVDPYTGEVDFAGDTVGVVEPTDLDPDTPIPFDGGVLIGPEGLDDGPAIAMARTYLPYFDVGFLQWVAVRRTGSPDWGSVSNICPVAGSDVSALDGRVWYAEPTAEGVAWSGHRP